MDEARIKLLIELGRIPEAAGIHAKNGDVLKAIEMLSAPAAHGVDHVRPMIEHLLAGLRRELTLGILPTSSPVAPKLLIFAKRLDKSAMTEHEVNEASPSHQLNRWDLHPSNPSLQCLKQSDVTTVQAFARSPKLSLGKGKTSLLCCAWTVSSHLLPSCEISCLPKFRHRSPFTLTTSTC